MDLCNLCIEYTVTSALGWRVGGLGFCISWGWGDVLYQKHFMMLSVKVAKPRKNNNVYLLVCLLLHVFSRAWPSTHHAIIIETYTILMHVYRHHHHDPQAASSPDIA